jgi:hypothetical protein
MFAAMRLSPNRPRQQKRGLCFFRYPLPRHRKRCFDATFYDAE